MLRAQIGAGIFSHYTTDTASLWDIRLRSFEQSCAMAACTISVICEPFGVVG